jgi:hypothetical protein
MTICLSNAIYVQNLSLKQETETDMKKREYAKSGELFK